MSIRLQLPFLPIHIKLIGHLQEGAPEAWGYELSINTPSGAELIGTENIFTTEDEATKAALDWATRHIDLALRVQLRNN